MSTEYIERGALPKPRYIDIDAFLASENVNNVYGDYWELKEKLDEIPAADVEPVVHARWEWRNDRLVCSNCWKEANGFYDSEEGVSRYYPTKFCPDCGAHMDERSDA